MIAILTIKEIMKEVLKNFTEELEVVFKKYGNSDKGNRIKESLLLIKSIDPIMILRHDSIELINSLYENDEFIRFIHILSYRFFSIYDDIYIINNLTRGINFYSNNPNNTIPPVLKNSMGVVPSNKQFNDFELINNILLNNRHIVMTLLIILINLEKGA